MLFNQTCSPKLKKKQKVNSALNSVDYFPFKKLASIKNHRKLAAETVRNNTLATVSNEPQK